MSQNPYNLKQELLLYALLAAIALAPPAAFVGLFLYTWRDTTPRGPLVSPRDWPAPIRELLDEMKTQVPAPAFEVYLLHGQPGWTVSTVMCRIEDAPGVFDFLHARLKLNSVPADDYWGDLFADALPTDWQPATRTRPQYFASQHWLDGGEGTLYALVRDQQAHRLFLYYYFNF